MTRAEVFAAIDLERERQAIMWSRPHDWGHGDCSSDYVPATVKTACLTEECGEVARAVLERDGDTLATELIQVAAIAVAWLEGDTCTF
jgi:NTP pyrophosphatase (non-canonical NTP hydrolase)